MQPGSPAWAADAAAGGEAGLTADSLLGGRVRLLQPARGYRVAIDPVLLAAAVPASAGESALDAGLGTGAAALCLLARVPGLRAVGIEARPDLAAIAARSAALNGAALEVVAGDLLDPPAEVRRRAFDHVLTNPPYLGPGEGTASPVAQREAARAGDVGLAAWLDACLRRLAPGGRLTLVHRADRLDRVLAALAGKAGGAAVLPLWPGEGRPARRVLVAARKGSRAPLALLPGLVLHGPDGRLTPAAEAVLRDGEPLALEA